MGPKESGWFHILDGLHALCSLSFTDNPDLAQDDADRSFPDRPHWQESGTQLTSMHKAGLNKNLWP